MADLGRADESVLSATLRSSLRIGAERAALDAARESVPLAHSEMRPQIRAFANASYGHADVLDEISVDRAGAFGVEARYTLFSGFRLRNGVRRAKVEVAAGEARLRSTIQDVLVDAVNAQTAVETAETAVEIRADTIVFYENQLAATRRRYQAGEATRVDVALAEASYYSAQASHSLAEAALSSTRARYRATTGAESGVHRDAAVPDVPLPKSVEDAVLQARSHPDIVAAHRAVDAARLDVDIARADMMPTVSLTGRAQRDFDDFRDADRSDTFNARVQVDIPLYLGGRTASSVRRARAVLGQRQIEFDLARIQVETEVTTAYADLEAAHQAVTFGEAEVKAAQKAVNGVARQVLAGEKTILEVSQSRQNLDAARLRLSEARARVLSATYTLLAATGGLDGKPVLKSAPAPSQAAAEATPMTDFWRNLRRASL